MRYMLDTGGCMGSNHGDVRLAKPTSLTRRRFLGSAGAMLGSSWLAGLPGCSGSREGLEQARRKAVERRRRLILDDDGDLVYDPEAAKGAEAFVGLRVKPVLGTPVDSIAWCIMWGIAQGPGQTRYWETQQQDRPLNEAIHDPTPLMVDGIRGKGLEVFGSIRMKRHPRCLRDARGEAGLSPEGGPSGMAAGRARARKEAPSPPWRRPGGPA